MNRTSILSGAFASMALVAALAPQSASAINWNLDQACGGSVTCTAGSGGGDWGNKRAYTSSGVTLTASAFSDTSGNSSPFNIENAHLERYSGGGLGVNNQDGCSSNCSGKDFGDTLSSAPEHAVDNNERYDSVLFDFGQAIQLTDVSFGWSNGAGADTDFTILYSSTGTLSGLRYNQLTGNGWAALGSYDSAGTGVKNLGNAGTFARYWLVIAYNPLFAGSCTGCDGGDDYFKINGAKGNARDRDQKVPEPGTLALLGLGLAGLGMTRRRR